MRSLVDRPSATHHHSLLFITSGGVSIERAPRPHDSRHDRGGFRPAHPHPRTSAAVVRLANALPARAGSADERRGPGVPRPLVLERKRLLSTCSQAANASRFPLHVRSHPRTDFHVPLPKQPQKLPEVSPGRGVALLAAPRIHAIGCAHHRLRAGLRVSEAIALKVSDIDPDRMTMRNRAQGKGRQGSLRAAGRALLHDLARTGRPPPPGRLALRHRQGTRPIDITSPRKIYTMAKLRARHPEAGRHPRLAHAFATHLLEAGVDLRTPMQRLLGLPDLHHDAATSSEPRRCRPRARP